MTKPTNDVIRQIFLAHGFKIPLGMDDMRPYVYEAAKALLKHYGVWIYDPESIAETIRAELNKPEPESVGWLLEGTRDFVPGAEKPGDAYEPLYTAAQGEAE